MHTHLVSMNHWISISFSNDLNFYVLLIENRDTSFLDRFAFIFNKTILAERCKRARNQNRRQHERVKRGLARFISTMFIYPGTKWCGKGEFFYLTSSTIETTCNGNQMGMYTTFSAMRKAFLAAELFCDNSEIL